LKLNKYKSKTLNVSFYVVPKSEKKIIQKSFKNEKVQYWCKQSLTTPGKKEKKVKRKNSLYIYVDIPLT